MPPLSCPHSKVLADNRTAHPPDNCVGKAGTVTELASYDDIRRTTWEKVDVGTDSHAEERIVFDNRNFGIFVEPGGTGAVTGTIARVAISRTTESIGVTQRRSRGS